MLEELSYSNIDCMARVFAKEMADLLMKLKDVYGLPNRDRLQEFYKADMRRTYTTFLLLVNKSIDNEYRRGGARTDYYRELSTQVRVQRARREETI